VTVYTVGVGQYANEAELKAVATVGSYYFRVDNYQRIDEVAGPLADATCAGKCCHIVTKGKHETVYYFLFIKVINRKSIWFYTSFIIDN